MKARKCPKCKFIEPIVPTFGQYFNPCPNCGLSFYDVRYELVEVIDWEYELITNNNGRTI